MIMAKYFYIIILFFIIIGLLVVKKDVQKHCETSFYSVKENTELIASIEKINKNIDAINYLFYKNIKIKLKNGLLFNAKAKLSFKKDDNIRIVVDNFFGKQMDIGSNKELFWFWSKYNDPPFHYIFKHKDLKEANLKAFLAPEWILESMGFKKISVENIVFVESIGKGKGIKQLRKSPSGENISIITLINTEKNFVTGRYLLNDNQDIIASVEYKSYFVANDISVPDKIIVFFENIFMEWTISDIKINVSCPDF